MKESAPERRHGFAIVYKVAVSRFALGVGGGITAALLKSGRSERLFPPAKGERKALIAKPDSLGRFFLVNAGDMGETMDLLEKLKGSESVELAYVAPPRFVLATRRQAFVAAGKPPTQNFRDQIRWSAAQALPQWNCTQPVSIGVLDSGYDTAHPQLVNGTFQQYLRWPGARNDALGHGSHVFGQLVAERNAGNTFEGLVPDCSSATMSCGLADPHDAAGYYRALQSACTARLVNLSVGGEHEDQLETDIVRDAIARGSIVVAAMGNDAELNSPITYPAAIEDVLAVGAVDHAGKRAFFSN
ncbi:MAG: S8 family serine peptidase, partial [Steroidobacteraceae bacterium]